jgi:hypothetical protein
MHASILTLVAFSAYDAFVVAFLNRIHSEGFNCRAICRAVFSVPLDALRLVNAIFTTFLGKVVVCIPPNPHASNSTFLVTQSHQLPAPPEASTPLSTFVHVKEDEVSGANASVTRSATMDSTTRDRTTRCFQAVLTAFFGGPLYQSPDSRRKNVFQVMRLPNQLGVVHIRKRTSQK